MREANGNSLISDSVEYCVGTVPTNWFLLTRKFSNDGLKKWSQTTNIRRREQIHRQTVNVRKSTKNPISEGRDPESSLFDTLIPAVMKVNEKEILAV
jgi:hypothetical protein